MGTGMTGSDFGFIQPAEPPHHRVTDSSSRWATAASAEFASIQNKLTAAIQAYDENEDTAAALSRELNQEIGVDDPGSSSGGETPGGGPRRTGGHMSYTEV